MPSGAETTSGTETPTDSAAAAMRSRLLLLAAPLLLEAPLALPLLGLELGDLILDRRVERLPLDELALDPLALLGALRDDLRLLRSRLRELALAHAHLGPGPADLLHDADVLLGDALGRVEPVDELVEAGRPEDHLERRLLALGVERHQALGEVTLGEPVGPAGDGEVPLVLLDVGLDLVEPQRRGVVGLDRELEVPVDLGDLRQHALGLGLGSPDLGRGGHGRGGRREGGHGCHRDHREHPPRMATDDRPLPAAEKSLRMPADSSRAKYQGRRTGSNGNGNFDTQSAHPRRNATRGQSGLAPMPRQAAAGGRWESRAPLWRRSPVARAS